MNESTRPSDAEILQLARATAVEVLAPSGPFQAMSLADQQSVYLSLVEEEIDRERARRGLAPRDVAKAMATDSGEEMGFEGYRPGFEGSTEAFNELVDSVDFPQFVADLMKAVFNANLKVMKEQTDSYIKLMKEATKSTADFITKIKDDESFLKLAETRGAQYGVTTERAADGSQKMALTTPEGDKVDPEDSEVKRHILEAKINMAKEHRAALREVLLMGVTRLVVEKGVIEAGVEFMITANRKSQASHQDQNVNVVNVEASYDPPLGGLFGGPSGSMSMTNTNIQVNTSQKEATDTLSAKLTGKVNIQFKTDYFKLDNFATMYADGGVAALPPGQGAAPGAAPGGAAPARR
ncbi:hypothetical protein PX701_09650 [Agromyces sp. H3Y2-19a]|jgi:hypothetical protein|uniref:hypothetical protein n=1 Tax=Agromyces TaxID=33877 RepID=UPI001E39AD48|nr:MULTISPECIES: hypothetical protein [Agromyces]MCD5344938.1 hypothetical protein [Agromyces sp. S2-1-8]MDF0513884.1 hypothetical protein [Agromyces chromiiresistens]